MPLSMALAGTVSEVIGLTTTFLIAGLVPPVLAVVAIVAARMPADEIAHPLDTGAPQGREEQTAAELGDAEPVTPGEERLALEPA